MSSYIRHIVVFTLHRGHVQWRIQGHAYNVELPPLPSAIDTIWKPLFGDIIKRVFRIYFLILASWEPGRAVFGRFTRSKGKRKSKGSGKE